MDEIPEIVRQLVEFDAPGVGLRVYGPPIEDVQQFRNIWQSRYNDSTVAGNTSLQSVSRKILELVDSCEKPEILTYISTTSEPPIMILYEAKTGRALRV